VSFSQLGHFNLAGIADMKVGGPRITITFQLRTEHLLKVTAFYQNGNRSCHLLMKGKRPLRKLAII